MFAVGGECVAGTSDESGEVVMYEFGGEGGLFEIDYEWMSSFLLDGAKPRGIFGIWDLFVSGFCWFPGWVERRGFGIGGLFPLFGFLGQVEVVCLVFG